jgi:hypothetical protein
MKTRGEIEPAICEGLSRCEEEYRHVSAHEEPPDRSQPVAANWVRSVRAWMLQPCVDLGRGPKDHRELRSAQAKGIGLPPLP